LSQFYAAGPATLKMTLYSKVAKLDPKIIISLRKSESLTLSERYLKQLAFRKKWQKTYKKCRDNTHCVMS